MRIRTNVDLTNHSTFRLPAQARTFIVLETEADVMKWYREYRSMADSWYMLGEGSNTFFVGDVPGVVQLDFRQVDFSKGQGGSATAYVGSAVSWDEFVETSIEEGYSGIEALSAIPGTVGAAPVQNIGAYGTECKDVCLGVRAFDMQTGEWTKMSPSQCQFGYRTSVFKQNPNRYLITGVWFKLDRASLAKVPEYPGVLEAMHENDRQIGVPVCAGRPTPRAIRTAITHIRWNKLPKPTELPNCGSCFENAIVDAETFENLISRYPEMPSWKTDTGYKISSGWLIDQAGLKGYCIDGICTYDKHALVLVNRGGNGKALLGLVDHIIKMVQERFGVTLRLEPNVVGLPYGKASV